MKTKTLSAVLASILSVSGCANPNIFSLFKYTNPTRPDGNIVPWCFDVPSDIKSESFPNEEEARAFNARTIILADFDRRSTWADSREIEEVYVNVEHPHDYGNDSKTRYSWVVGKQRYVLETKRYQQFPEERIRKSILESKSKETPSSKDSSKRLNLDIGKYTIMGIEEDKDKFAFA